MEEIIKAVVDNGLGVASFIALIVFVFKYQEKNNTLMAKISDTIVEIQKSLTANTDALKTFNERLNNIENELYKKEN